ncbi:hypothetical protein BKA64DRAFT_766428, partial [Cadophora sp. MPI-SDFR-AT-0126]
VSSESQDRLDPCPVARTPRPRPIHTHLPAPHTETLWTTPLPIHRAHAFIPNFLTFINSINSISQFTMEVAAAIAAVDKLATVITRVETFLRAVENISANRHETLSRYFRDMKCICGHIEELDIADCDWQNVRASIQDISRHVEEYTRLLEKRYRSNLGWTTILIATGTADRMEGKIDALIKKYHEDVKRYVFSHRRLTPLFLDAYADIVGYSLEHKITLQN